MNATAALRHCRRQVIAAGGVLVRVNSGHAIYHVNGRLVVLPTHPGAWRSPRLLKNITAELRRAVRATGTEIWGSVPPEPKR